MIALIAMLLLTLIVVVEPAATTSDRDDNPMFQAMSANGTTGSRQSWWWRHKYLQASIREDRAREDVMKRFTTITLSIILVLIVAAPMASGQSSDTSQRATSART